MQRYVSDMGNNHVIIHGINPKLLLSNVVNK